MGVKEKHKRGKGGEYENKNKKNRKNRNRCNKRHKNIFIIPSTILIKKMLIRLQNITMTNTSISYSPQVRFQNASLLQRQSVNQISHPVSLPKP